MLKVSCVTASYVADQIEYPGGIDWGLAAETITRRPMLELVDGMLERLAPAQLAGIEFWFPHVWPANITPALASAIRQRLAARGMVCCACAGGVGDPQQDPYGSEERFQTACLLGAPLIAGHANARAIPWLSRLCARYGVRLAHENGRERDASQIQAVIQRGNGWIGAALDTGNLAAQGGDPVGAIRQIGERIMHVHMKDVPAVGSHECVALGSGIVDVRGVVRELKTCGYDGWLSIEIETADHDPTQEIIASAQTLRRLWGG